MKNKFLLLMILGIVFFASCSDSDNKDTPKDFNGIYSTTSTDRVLDLKYSNAVFIGKSVDFNSVDGKSATLKLQGVVPGESETVFSSVPLVSSSGIYTFSSVNEDAVRKVTLEGSIEKGKLTVKVDVAFVQNDLMKKWDFSTVNMVWKPTNYVLFEVDLGGIFGKQKVQTGLVTLFAPSMLAQMLKSYLQDVSFRNDGNIVATYNAAESTEEITEPVANWQSSPLNLVQYRVKDDICYVFLNMDMIMRQVGIDQEGRATGTDQMLVALEQLLTNGIPVHFKKTVGEDAKDELYVYVDEVLIKQLGTLLPMLETLIPEDMTIDIPILTKTVAVPVKTILENLPGALEATTEMQVGLQFKGAE